MSNEVWDEIYEKLEGLIRVHKTTLIFVNTRRLSERMTHNLTERFGAGVIAAHHGSISKELRLDAEQEAQVGRVEGYNRDRLSRARDRHRRCGPRMPDRLSQIDRHVPPEGRALRAYGEGDSEGQDISAQPGRASGMRGALRCCKTRGARQHNHARKAARRACAADSR